MIGACQVLSQYGASTQTTSLHDNVSKNALRYSGSAICVVPSPVDSPTIEVVNGDGNAKRKADVTAEGAITAPKGCKVAERGERADRLNAMEPKEDDLK